MLIIDRYSYLYSYSSTSTRTRTRTHVIIKYSDSYSYSHILQVLVLVLVLVNLVLAPALPQIGEAIGTHHVGSLEEDDPNLLPPISHIMEAEPDPAPCGCPKRTQPPPPPTELPHPATEANRERLQEFLLDYYGSSTFNTCPHQRLSLMEAPPMRLMVDHSAQPVAHHKAIPVPLHWCDDVKAGLDRDVQLGVLEPVPIGEPVTWCHRMVVCAKKDGSPRRTVDLQALN